MRVRIEKIDIKIKWWQILLIGIGLVMALRGDYRALLKLLPADTLPQHFRTCEYTGLDAQLYCPMPYKKYLQNKQFTKASANKAERCNYYHTTSQYVFKVDVKMQSQCKGFYISFKNETIPCTHGSVSYVALLI